MGLTEPKNQSGFTLLELLLAVALIGIALCSIYDVFASVTKSNTGNEAHAEVLQTLRTSLGYMEQDLRMAGLDRFMTADAGIEVATATGIRFTGDRNMDGVINAANLTDGIQDADLERITYFHEVGAQRLRQCLSEGTTSESWDTVADHVENLQFQYFDENETLLSFPIVDLTRIRSVAVSLTISQPSGFQRHVVRTLSKKILCRNLSM